MTWSIVAHDPDTGTWGIAVATRFFAVGALCPHIRPGVGALATQALVNPTYGKSVLDLLESGVSAQDAVQAVVARDDGRAARQLHVIDANGRIAAYTGEDCIGWSGHCSENNVSVAGNMLAGPEVLTETTRAFQVAVGRPMAERLLSAMDAGEAAGGDKRGRQSACLIVQTTEDYPQLSIRVDDHENPLVELRRLYEVSRGRFATFMDFLPTRANPSGIFDRTVIEAEVARREAILKRGGSV